jgi:hypothetical protein
MRFSRVHQVGTKTSKRRDCPKCGHADTVLIEEIYRIIAVTKREKKLPPEFRRRKTVTAQLQKPMQQ